MICMNLYGSSTFHNTINIFISNFSLAYIIVTWIKSSLQTLILTPIKVLVNLYNCVHSAATSNFFNGDYEWMTSIMASVLWSDDLKWPWVIVVGWGMSHEEPAEVIWKFFSVHFSQSFAFVFHRWFGCFPCPVLDPSDHSLGSNCCTTFDWPTTQKELGLVLRIPLKTSTIHCNTVDNIS